MNPKSKRFFLYIKRLKALTKIPGIACATIDSGNIEFLLAGKADKSLKIDKDTKFPISSLTKAFTCVLVKNCVDNNLIGWNDTVLNDLSLKDVLTHNNNYPNFCLDYLGYLKYGENKIIESLDNVEPKKKKKSFSYNNTCFVFAGELLQKLTGKTFANLLRTEITEPVGMNNTGVLGQSIPTAVPNIGIFRNKEIALVNFPKFMKSAAGIVSTIEDMSKWLQYWLMHSSSKLSPLLEHSIPSRYYIENGEYCMGWYKNKESGLDIYRHTGGFPGIACLIMFCPQKQTGFVLLANKNTFFLKSVFNKFEKIFLGVQSKQTSYSLGLLGKCIKYLIRPRRLLNSKFNFKAEGKFYNKILGELEIKDSLIRFIEPSIVASLRPFMGRKFEIHFDREELKIPLEPLNIEFLSNDFNSFKIINCKLSYFVGDENIESLTCHRC